MGYNLGYIPFYLIFHKYSYLKIRIMREETILIINQYETIRNIVKANLKSLGFTKFLFGSTSIDIFDNLELNKPDLLICEYSLFSSTVDNFLDEINIPKLIMINQGENIKHAVTKIALNGGDGYIIKPFSANELSDKINKIFDKYNIEKTKVIK